MRYTRTERLLWIGTKYRAAIDGTLYGGDLYSGEESIAELDEYAKHLPRGSAVRALIDKLVTAYYNWTTLLEGS